MSYNQKIVDHLEKRNVSFSVNVLNRNITKSDIEYNRQEIPRIDCNKFKYGNV